MSWHKLTNSELQACRKLLMIDVSEAAELIGNCSARTWQRWEDGTYNVPEDVESEIYGLIQQRNDLVEELTKWQLDNDEQLLQMKYYHTFDQFLAEHSNKNKVDWRIHQAAVSFVFSEGGNVELI